MDIVKELMIGRPYHREFWALKDVSFEVKRGEVFGFVGRNGAGKSTLLKILTGVLEKTEGLVEIRGKVAAILELGTGFNGEFSGRENIYMGGLCLGMSRSQIDRELNNIVAFSELESFIDQPFKTYSSGMKSRLTFATAISVNPEILIVDEALSVGDAKFQRKCFAKFDELRRAGKTILFVSHSMDTVTTLCDRAVLLENGRVLSIDIPSMICKQYLHLLFGDGGRAAEKTEVHIAIQSAGASGESDAPSESSGVPSTDVSVPSPDAALLNDRSYRFGSRQAEVVDFGFTDSDGRRVADMLSGQTYTLFQKIVCHEDVPALSVGYLIRNVRGIDLFGITNVTQGIPIPPQRKGTVIETHARIRMSLAAGDYFLTAGVARDDGVQLDSRNDALHFKVVGPGGIFTTSLVNLEASFSVLIESAREEHVQKERLYQ